MNVANFPTKIAGGHKGGVVKTLSGAVCLSLFSSLFVSSLAVAQSSGYVPPQGEQPDYEKKYRPTDVKVDWVIELNPMMLLRRGLALEVEKRIQDSLTLGVDFLYANADLYESSGVVGSTVSYAVMPKIRLYPLPSLSGIFFGFKTLIGNIDWKIEDDNSELSESQLLIAPTAHVGYRINSFSGVTFSLYVGGGANLMPVEIDSKDIPADASSVGKYKKAAKAIENYESTFRPDFGLTVGVAM